MLWTTRCAATRKLQTSTWAAAARPTVHLNLSCSHPSLRKTSRRKRTPTHAHSWKPNTHHIRPKPHPHEDHRASPNFVLPVALHPDTDPPPPPFLSHFAHTFARFLSLHPSLDIVCTPLKPHVFWCCRRTESSGMRVVARTRSHCGPR